MPILAGVDGERKMSKSLGNHVGVGDAPEEMYGKTLSLPDEAMAGWYQLLLGEPAPPELSARDAKHALARRLVERFHSPAAADAAAAHFDRVFVQHALPEEIEDADFSATDGVVHVPALIADALGRTRSDARRMLAQGAVKLDGETLGAEDLDLAPARLDGAILQVGKRQFRRLRRRQ
jgi:tyrosyl-tRNA synthetase